MTRRAIIGALFAIPAAVAKVTCGPDRLCGAAMEFKDAWGDWAIYRNSISPQSRDFEQHEARLWDRQQQAHVKVGQARSS